jgi:hypothetical protein
MIVSATAPSPCKDCEDRCIGCHTTCGDYAIYRQTLEQNRARINAQNDENAFMSEIKREVYKRHNKRRNGDDR